MYMFITHIYTYICYVAYRTLDPRYTLPYIPIRVLCHTKLQTLGENPEHRSIVVRVCNIEIALSPQRHLRVAGHDTGNGRRESQKATVLATERAVTVRPREYIIVHLGQMVIAVLRVSTSRSELLDRVRQVCHGNEIYQYTMGSQAILQVYKC